MLFTFQQTLIRYNNNGILASGDVTFKNNAIRANGTDGFLIPSQSPTITIKVYNNVFDDNHQSAMHFYNNQNNANGNVYSNYITNSINGIIAVSSSAANSIDFKNNGLYNNTTNYTNVNSNGGDFYGDPSYTSYYYLPYNYNCWDAGFYPPSPQNVHLEFMDRDNFVLDTHTNNPPNMVGLYGGPEAFHIESSYLPSSVTGIEDGIEIDEYLDHYNINQNYINEIQRIFVDEPPLGDYIVSWDNWKITASYGCGEVTLYDGSSSDFELPDLPEGYKWERDDNGYVMGTLSTGGTDEGGFHHTSSMPIKIGNVPNTFITSGTLTVATTNWCGDITLTGNITVPSGKTLIIHPGAVINFPSNSSLIVNGNLEAMGCTFTAESGTSPGSWGSIDISGSGASGSYIKYAYIEYGNQIDVINANNVSIQHCNITNSSGLGIEFSGGTDCSASYNTIANSNVAHGILVENGANVTVNDNVIYKTNQNHQGVGIDFGGGGTGIAARNDIEGFNWGICAIWGSSPTSHNVNYPAKNNRITNCSVGLDVYYSSYPTFGIPSAGDTYGGNSIYGNTYNVNVGLSYSNIASGLYACYNWWGSYPANTSLFQKGSAAYFNYTPSNEIDLWTGYPLPSIKQVPVISPSDKLENKIASTQNTEDVNQPGSSFGVTDSLFAGIDLISNNKFNEAKDYFVSYIKKHPDNQAAYTFLYNCADSSTIQDITNFFEKLPSKASKGNEFLLSYLYLRQGKVDLAKSINDKIISVNPNAAISVRAMLNNFYIALYNENDVNTAAALLNSVEKNSSLSTPMEIATAEDDYNEYGGLLSSLNKVALPEIQPAAMQKEPTSYSLSQCYPNPFNPSTTIHYEIPDNGFVTLKVYDILGREVKTLVNQYESKGRYDINFNADNLASGIYIYRLQSGNFISTKKMILLK